MRRTALVFLWAASCSEAPPDPALATPVTTARTLLAAYDLEGLTDAQIRRRLRRGLASSSERPVSEALLAKCFADYDATDPMDRGLAVFLVGAIAARRDRLQESMAGDQGSVYVPGELLVVMERKPEGWKIVLDRSIPAVVRSGLRQER